MSPAANRGRKSLLLDESVVSPEAPRVTVAGIHELDVVADDAQNSEIRMLRCGQAVIAGEVLLHLLLLTCLGVLIGGVELVFRQASKRAGPELEGLLRLENRILSLRNGCGGSETDQQEKSSVFVAHLLSPMWGFT